MTFSFYNRLQPSRYQLICRTSKGVLAQALDEVWTQRGATHIVVNAAHTSQMDSLTGLLHGRREGDRFYRVNGDVLQADANAARNVRNRIHDQDITRYMPHVQVKQILLARSSGATERHEASVGRHKSRQRSADKSNAQLEQLLWNRPNAEH